MRQILSFVVRFTAPIVAVVALVGFLFPDVFLWIPTSSINYMLGIVMLGMGMTLDLSDLRLVFVRPRDILVGCAAQFVAMPAIAWGLVRLFALPPDLAVGVILVGSCPGGTASNVITFLAGGDLALSVGMTGISTLFAPVLTPMLVWLLVGQEVGVDVAQMMLSIVSVVLAPVALGVALQRWTPVFSQRVRVVLPSVSVLTIAAIVGVVVSRNEAQLHAVGVVVFAVVVLHNALGFGIGALVGWLLGMSRAKRVAVSVEVGMQNSGLACSLAASHFAALALASVPGAFFSVWHNVAGALVARLYASSKDINVE